MYRLVKSIAEQRTIFESSINDADCFEARGAEGNITVKLRSRQGNQHRTYHQKTLACVKTGCKTKRRKS